MSTLETSYAKMCINSVLENSKSKITLTRGAEMFLSELLECTPFEDFENFLIFLVCNRMWVTEHFPIYSPGVQRFLHNEHIHLQKYHVRKCYESFLCTEEGM
jgi:hypothetical protein